MVDTDFQTSNNHPNLYEPQIMNRILRLPEVIDRVGLRRASIYVHMSQGSFPKAIAIGSRAVGWLEHEIEAWLKARIQTRSINRK